MMTPKPRSELEAARLARSDIEQILTRIPSGRSDPFFCDDLKHLERVLSYRYCLEEDVKQISHASQQRAFQSWLSNLQKELEDFKSIYFLSY